MYLSPPTPGKTPTGIVMSRWALVKQITEFIYKVIEDGDEDVAMHHLKTVLKRLEQMTDKTENSDRDDSRVGRYDQNFISRYSSLYILIQ